MFPLLFVGNCFQQRNQFPTNNKEINFLQTTKKTISYKQQRKQFPTSNKENNFLQTTTKKQFPTNNKENNFLQTTEKIWVK
jgi:hypothetical protein